MAAHVVSILCSDIHFSHTPPAARSGEPDWYAAMARPMAQIGIRQRQLGGVPVICAGDVFHRWNSPPELINFVMDVLPDDFWTIRGQHDMPNHVEGEMHRSAYTTLIKSGQANEIPSWPVAVELDGLSVHGFPWEHPIQPRNILQRSGVQLAVVHAYCWQPGSCYPGALPGLEVEVHKTRLIGYDAAVFGDNHKGFQAGKIYNSGTLMRRNSDELDYRPTIGLLYSDGTIVPEHLDVSQDVIEKTDVQRTETDFSPVLEELVSLSKDSLDFETLLGQAIEQFGENIKVVVREALENARLRRPVGTL